MNFIHFTYQCLKAPRHRSPVARAFDVVAFCSTIHDSLAMWAALAEVICEYGEKIRFKELNTSFDWSWPEYT